MALALAGSAMGQAQYSWRYYRPGNTGIQGDYCDALWIGPDNDPWIGGYDPGFEEGGLAKFVQAENRWINVSNVDYPEIGHPDNTGTTRARDITPDAQGNLWMGTGRGVLRFNPSVGPSSLKRWGADNSPWPGGWVTNIEIAPDGTVWASGYSTVWGGGGLMRYNPSTSAWTYLGSGREEMLAIQPRPGGGYYLWSGDRSGSTAQTSRYDSTTQSWTTFPSTNGNPRNLPGNKCVDAAGNMWIYRVLPDNFNVVLDCRRPDGSWVGVPAHPGGGASVTRAFGTLQALTDGGGQVWRFNGTSWSGLGDWGNINWTYDLGIDSAGAVWACGVGGAAKRNPATGVWQRYRITNTSQFDSFNNDLSLNQASGEVWACANAGPGAGGMTRFDGTRWIGYNQLTYGLGFPWPFPTDNSQSVYQRPSTGAVVVNPMFNGTSQLTGTTWTALPGGSGKVIQYTEDSTGRLWQLGEYFNLSYWTGSAWTNVGIAAWGSQLRVDPDRPGTVWAHAGYEVVRTDGTYRFSRTIDDFPELTSQSDTIWGMAVGRNGVAWLGCSVFLGAGGSGGGLIRLDASTGAYTMMKYESGWPLPGKYVSPWAVTPDGRVWMTYTPAHQSFEGGGLCWYDPATGAVGTFPGPVPSGSPQWGGLPHTQIYDVETRLIPGGYELWMSCPSRGIAVLAVTGTVPSACYANCDASSTTPVLNVNDFTCFLNRFAAGDSYANCDGSTVPPLLNVNDFTCFLNLFAGGCT
ncbi:MAG: GC-type dockerin domain-anchored protein [Phycisphaerales bacterium]